MRKIPKQLARTIEKKIARLDEIAEDLPGVVIIHNIRTSEVVYMSRRGQEILGVTLEELKEMGTEYFNRFFNPDDAAYYVPKILGLLEHNNSDEILTYFQQVRQSENDEYKWYKSSTKIFERDTEGKPLLIITISSPIDPEFEFTRNVTQMLEEKITVKSRSATFSKLGKREREVLRHIVTGKTNTEIAKELSLSVATVETHRKNIKNKLQVLTLYELIQIAKAFDLA